MYSTPRRGVARSERLGGELIEVESPLFSQRTWPGVDDDVRTVGRRAVVDDGIDRRSDGKAGLHSFCLGGPVSSLQADGLSGCWSRRSRLGAVVGRVVVAAVAVIVRRGNGVVRSGPRNGDTEAGQVADLRNVRGGTGVLPEVPGVRRDLSVTTRGISGCLEPGCTMTTMADSERSADTPDDCFLNVSTWCCRRR